MAAHKQIGKQKMSQSEDFSGISDDAVKLYANEGLPTPQVNKKITAQPKLKTPD
jgi:hypothetical protein